MMIDFIDWYYNLKDDEILEEITKETNPKVIKALGRKVKHFGEMLWRYKLFKEYDFGPGIIRFNNSDICSNEVLNNDNINLTEDMLQVEFINDIILDFGWYRGIESFIVFVIQQCNWENPILRLEAHSYKELKDSLDNAMDLIKSLIGD